MDREQAIEIAKKYSEIVAVHLPVKKVYLYGSYSADTAGEFSDIDIAVLIDRLEGDYLETSAKLFRLRREFDLRIEPILLLDNGTDKSGFVEEVKSTGYTVYPD